MGKRLVIAYSNSKGLGEPAPVPVIFAHVSVRPRGNFISRLRHVDSLRGRDCALKG